MKRFFNFVTQGRRWALLFLPLWILPPLLIILVLVGVLSLVPANAYLRAERIGAVWLLASSLLVILPSAIAGIYYWRSYYRAREQLSAALNRASGLEQSKAVLEKQLNVITERAGLSIRLYPEGFGDIDYVLVEKLFPNCQEVKLGPSIKGFSGAMVFLAESRDKDGSLQQPSVVKLGPFKKIQNEAENYDNYVKDFAGNAPELREPQYDKDDTRGGLRFSYAGMEGKVSTFEGLIDSNELVAKVLTHDMAKAVFDSDETTTKTLYPVWHRNLLKNIDLYKKHGSLADSFLKFGTNRAVIGVGAGPSFNRNKHVLKQIYEFNLRFPLEQQPFVIIVAQKQFKSLLREGIYPHFVLMIDAGDALLPQLCEDRAPFGRLVSTD